MPLEPTPYYHGDPPEHLSLIDRLTRLAADTPENTPLPENTLEQIQFVTSMHQDLVDDALVSVATELQSMLEQTRGRVTSSDALIMLIRESMPLGDPRRIRCERRSVLFFSGLYRKHKTHTDSYRPEDEHCRHQNILIESQSLIASGFYDTMRYNSPLLQLPDNANVLSIGNAGAPWALTHANASVVSLEHEVCFTATEPQVENHQVQKLWYIRCLQTNSQDVVRIANFPGKGFWDSLLAEVHRVLKPGSVLEICDHSREFSDVVGSPWESASFLFNRLSALGMDYKILASSTIGDTLMKAGFCKVGEASLRLPFPTRQGRKFATTVIKEMDGIRSFYGGFQWFSAPDWDVFTRDLELSPWDAGVSL